MKSIFQNKLFKYSFFAILAIVILLVFLSIITQGSSKVVHTSLKMVFDQSVDFDLSLKDISIEDLYPVDYKLNIRSNFYTVKVINKVKVLYTGKVNKKILTTWDIFESDSDRLIFQEGKNNLIEEIPNEIILYLPYYKDAESVQIYDEYGSLKLTVNLKDYSLPVPKSETNLCGNGICDTNENIFSCFSDCRNAPKWIWNSVSKSFLP